MHAAALLHEFEQESKGTRRMLESIPDEHLDYRPHEKSWTMRELATHLANLGGWTQLTFEKDEVDLAQEWPKTRFETTAELVAAFDAIVAAALECLKSVTAESFQEMWTLRTGETVHFTRPKGVVFRFAVLNHIVHHRGQLSVYLRACGAKVPGVYGPTADEGW